MTAKDHWSLSLGTATTTPMTLLVLLLLLQVAVHVDGAYLNPNAATSAAAAAAPPVNNQRYTFLTRPREKYFTSTGILPPLAPSTHDAVSEEDRAQSHSLVVSPLPPRSASSSSETTPTTTAASNQEPEIRVTYTNDPKTVDDWLCKNIPYDGCFLGFDIERLPEARSEHPHTAKDRSAFAHAAVVQLATPTACLVVHLVDSSYGGSSTWQQHHPKHSNACARILKKVLEDPSIVKAGCSIDEDLVLLHELWRKTPPPPQQHHSGGASGRHQPRHRHRPKHKNKRGSSSSSSTGGHHPHHRNHHHNHHNHNHAHHHGPSLHARSRFDLGCVVLPKSDSVAGFVALNDTMALLKEGDSDGLQHHPQNYKFVAKRTTTIANKSGLRGLCKSVLGVDLPKEKEHCASDWTQFPLGDDQITYAARDAWAGVAIATQLASLNVQTTQSSSSSTESSNTRNANDNKQTTTKSNVFQRSNLIQVLQKAETPLPQLAYRHRQRKEAKNELKTLLHPYARNLVLNQQNRRRHHHQQQEQIQAATVAAPPPLTASRNSTWTYRHNTTNHTNFQDEDKGDDTIDVEALFACYPLASRRTLANYAQQQQQLMEKSLPKRLKKRTLILRQTVNAKVIDHKVVFEIDMVDPTTHQRTAKGSHGQNANAKTNAKNPRRLSSQQQQQHRSRNHKRRNQHRRTRNPK